MPAFDSNGFDINYIDEGTGPPIVLIHGFASSLQGNWRAPGMVDALVGAGRRVVALDCRGHGRSAKPHDPSAYAGTLMADDAIALMDHLGIGKADLMGYSMGGFFAASLLARHPDRFNSVVLAGIGDAVLAGALPRDRSQAIADAMEGKHVEGANADTARNFRAFAKASGNDLEALAAMQRTPRGQFEGASLRDTKLPVLIVVGETDTLIGSADRLAATIPGATFVKVPGDHITAVGAPEFPRAVLEWLARWSPIRQ
jgi:pimeloyl-ACP methyl ester carboxylesterase